MMEILRSDIAREKISVLKDMLQCSDFQWIIIMSRRSPADVPFEVCLTEIWKIEDLRFQILHECPVGFLASDFERLSNVLQKMHVAELDDDMGVDDSRRHADGFIVVADHGQQFVTGVLELCEKLQQRLVILRGCQHADGNIVRQVIDAVNERNLLLKAFHGYKLPIHDEKAAESLGIAIGKGDLVVVRQSV